MQNFLYTHHSYQGWSILLHSDIRAQEVYGLISRDGRVCADDGYFTQVESSDNARVFSAGLSCNEQTEKVYIKHYLNRSLVDFCKHCFRSSRAERAFQASLMLRENGFYAPEPLILMQKKWGPLPDQSVLVTRKSQGEVQLAKLLLNLAGKDMSAEPERKRQLIGQFGSVVGRMHAKGIIHGDLRLGNVLVQEEENDFSFWFIDNESTRRFSRPPSRLVRKNLVQINKYGKVSNTDRMRFLLAYCRERDIQLKELKPLLDQVERKTIAWRIKKGKALG